MSASSPRTSVAGVVVLLFGWVLLQLARTDVLLRYVRPASRPLVLTAAVAMMSVAAVELTLGARTSSTEQPKARAAWLVIVPALFLLHGAPPALSVTFADRTMPHRPQPVSALPPLPSAGTVTLGLSDIVIRSDWNHGRSLLGHSLRVIGFVRDTVPHGFVLTRLAITCCAADAERNDLEVRTSAPAPPRGNWVEVTGRFAGMSTVVPYAPRLLAGSLHAIDQPAEPYE